MKTITGDRTLINGTSREKLKALLAGRHCVMMASIFDPTSSRIAQELGFEAGLMGGSLASQVVLAAPDLILLTLTELAEHVTRCTRVSNVPLIVDGDHGYGNALNVMRTVQEMDRAGAAAIMIEDTLLPRAYGSDKAQTLLTREESEGKMKAAVKARGNSDLLVLGRTGAASMSSVDEAIVRFKVFEAAGVDALFLPGIRSGEELERISSAVSLPIILGGVPSELCNSEYLAKRKVRLYSGGHQALGAVVQALYNAMKALHDGESPDKLPGIASKELMSRVSGATEYEQYTADFLNGEKLP